MVNRLHKSRKVISKNDLGKPDTTDTCMAGD